MIPGLASYGQRLVAFIIDYVLLSILVVAAVVVLFSGPTEIVRCDIDSDGNIIIFDLGGDDTRPGLCEQPTGEAFATAGFVLLLAVVAWFLYHAWEGATGKTVGKSIMGIRVVDEGTMEPIGGWKGIGRGVVEHALGAFTCGIGGIVDLLFPLWDDKNQTVHDKAVSSVVVKAAYMRPKGSALAAMQQGAAWALPGPVTYPTAPPPSSPTDPFGR